MGYNSIVAGIWLLSNAIATAGSITADYDLMSFVSKPALRPPILNVTKHDPSRITPGYFFVAPYADLYQRDPGKLEVAAQVGPHIYADDGTLIWSGAELFPTRTICDFRQLSYNGSLSISFIVTLRAGAATYPQGAAVILDDTYSIVEEILPPVKGTMMNMHEFKVEDDGSTALLMYDTGIQRTTLDTATEQWGWVDQAVAEIDVVTKMPRFLWNSSDYINMRSSAIPEPGPGERKVWDWIHLNAVDRDSHGDFLVTGRHTDAIYKISRSTGSVIWQLGGVGSSFEMLGFNFSRLHDARFIHANESITILSILDNASDGISMTANCSSAQLIQLDHQTSKASMIGQWWRPDGQLSHLRGNTQILPNNNVFVGWSGVDGYMSEHSPDGNVLMEARFVSERLSTYRAYKFFGFQGRPREPPVLAAFVYQTQSAEAFTVIYVSWNGAVDVTDWNFYGSQHEDAGTLKFLGRTRKSGFETTYTHAGLHRYVVAEAIAMDGTSMRNSTVTTSVLQQDACSQTAGEDMFECIDLAERQMHGEL